MSSKNTVSISNVFFKVSTGGWKIVYENYILHTHQLYEDQIKYALDYFYIDDF